MLSGVIHWTPDRPGLEFRDVPDALHRRKSAAPAGADEGAYPTVFGCSGFGRPPTSFG